MYTSLLDRVQVLYIGYLGRAGDPDGAAFWVSQLDSRAVTFEKAAVLCADNPEARAAYPYLASPLSGDAGIFIDSIYRNVFNRTPEQAGRDFWLDALATRHGSIQGVARIILDIISGAQGVDIETIKNKIAVGNYYTVQLAGLDREFVGSATHSLIAEVTSDARSVVTAKEAIDLMVNTVERSA